MTTRPLLIIALLGVASQGVAHPKNEPHLVDTDLEPIRESLRSLSGRINALEGRIETLDNQPVFTIEALNAALAEHATTSHAVTDHEHETPVWATPAVTGAAGGAAGGGLTVGGFAWWLFRRYLRRVLPGNDDQNGAEPTPATQSTTEVPTPTPGSGTTAPPRPDAEEGQREPETPTTETRTVTASRKDEDGNITALCNENEDWSPRMKDDAVDDINNRDIVYESLGPISGARAKVLARTSRTGWYLTTAPDRETDNNLDNLPDC